MKHQVAKLEGELLDAAVAKAEGHELVRDGTLALRDSLGRLVLLRHYSEWEHGGPIIERHDVMISLDYTIDGWDRATWRARTIETISAGKASRGVGLGPTPLVAAMRAYVASKFGDEVELP